MGGCFGGLSKEDLEQGFQEFKKEHGNTLVALHLQDDDAFVLYKVYRSVDEDNTGYIDSEEFQQRICKDVETSFMRERAFCVFDEVADHKISCREFIVGAMNYLLHDEASVELFTFDMIDTKACGIITRDMVFDFVKNMHGSKVALTDTVWRQLAKTLDSVIAARMETAVITAAEAQDPSLRRGISQKEFVEVIKTNKRFLQFALSIQTHLQDRIGGKPFWSRMTKLRHAPPNMGDDHEEVLTSNEPVAMKYEVPASRTQRSRAKKMGSGSVSPTKGSSPASKVARAETPGVVQFSPFAKSPGGHLTKARRRSVTHKDAAEDVGVEILVYGTLGDRRAARKQAELNAKRRERELTDEANTDTTSTDPAQGASGEEQSVEERRRSRAAATRRGRSQARRSGAVAREDDTEVTDAQAGVPTARAARRSKAGRDATLLAAVDAPTAIDLDYSLRSQQGNRKRLAPLASGGGGLTGSSPTGATTSPALSKATSERARRRSIGSPMAASPALRAQSERAKRRSVGTPVATTLTRKMRKSKTRRSASASESGTAPRPARRSLIGDAD